MTRKIVIKYKDGSEKELELGKATFVRSEKQMLNLDKIKDGKWRLIWKRPKRCWVDRKRFISVCLTRQRLHRVVRCVQFVRELMAN